MVHHLVDIAVVNGYILFREHQAKFPAVEELRRLAAYSLTDFREEIVRQLCNFPEYDDPPIASRSNPQRHPHHHIFFKLLTYQFLVLSGIIVWCAISRVEAD